MNIFSSIVPYVAFWFPNGVEKTILCEGEVVSNAYGLSAKMVINGKTVYCPIMNDAICHEGQRFTSCKIISLRKYGYAYSKTHRLIKKPVSYRYGDEAFIVWRVSELHK